MCYSAKSNVSVLLTCRVKRDNNSFCQMYKLDSEMFYVAFQRNKNDRKSPNFGGSYFELIGRFPNEIKTKKRYLKICCYLNFTS